MHKSAVAIPFFFFLLMIFGLNAPVYAQSADGTEARPHADGSSPNKHFKFADKKFWALAGLQVAATFADFETTQWAQRNAPLGAEQNPLFGGHPGRPRMYAIGGALTAGQILLQYRSKSFGERTGKLKKAWIVGALLNTGLHTFLAVHNARIAGQGDCGNSKPNCR